MSGLGVDLGVGVEGRVSKRVRTRHQTFFSPLKYICDSKGKREIFQFSSHYHDVRPSVLPPLPLSPGGRPRTRGSTTLRPTRSEAPSALDTHRPRGRGAAEDFGELAARPRRPGSRANPRRVLGMRRRTRNVGHSLSRIRRLLSTVECQWTHFRFIASSLRWRSVLVPRRRVLNPGTVGLSTLLVPYLGSERALRVAQTTYKS